VPTYISREDVDLSKFPTVVPGVQSQRQVTIGDLHGNFIKFLYFLLKEGVIVNRGIKARIDGAALCLSYRHN